MRTRHLWATTAVGLLVTAWIGCSEEESSQTPGGGGTTPTSSTTSITTDTSPTNPTSTSTSTSTTSSTTTTSGVDYVEVLVDGDSLWLVDAESESCGGEEYVEHSVDISSYADGASHTLRFHSETFGAGATNFWVDLASIEFCGGGGSGGAGGAGGAAAGGGGASAGGGGASAGGGGASAGGGGASAGGGGASAGGGGASAGGGGASSGGAGGASSGGAGGASSGGAGGSGGGSPGCEELVADNSFEQALVANDWDQFSTNYGTPACDSSCFQSPQAGAYDGSIWLWFGGTPDTYEEGWMEQDVVIPEGATTLTFYLVVPVCNGE